MRLSWLPNSITILRILLIPPYLYFFVKREYLYAIDIFLLAAISDVIDGYLARYLNMRTQFGAIVDPAGDKLLMFSTYLVMGITGWIQPWVVTIVIARDLWIVLGIFYLYQRDKKIKFQAIRLSKLNTFLQLLVILLTFIHAYLSQHSLHWLAVVSNYIQMGFPVIIILMVLSTLGSAWEYTMIGWNILKDRSE